MTKETDQLDRVCRLLDDLARALASGNAGPVAERTAQVEAEVAALSGLVERVRQDQERLAQVQEKDLAWRSTADVMRVRERLVRIRRRTAQIAEMLAHGEQVRAGMATILSLFYGVHTGAQYSANGAPSLPNVPRMMARG